MVDHISALKLEHIATIEKHLCGSANNLWVVSGLVAIGNSGMRSHAGAWERENICGKVTFYPVYQCQCGD